MQEGGMLATHRHEAILGGSRVERMLSNAAEQRSVASEPAHGMPSRPSNTMQPNRGGPSRVVQEVSEDVTAPSASSSQEPTALALLAAWKNISLEQMATRLLNMNAEERTQLREQYAGV